MAVNSEDGFTAIEDILAPPAPPTLAPRNDRMAHLQSELERLEHMNKHLSHSNERRMEMVEASRSWVEKLEGEVNRQKTSLEDLQLRYGNAQQRTSLQENELLHNNVEIDHLQKCIDQLEPQLAQLQGWDLELKTYRLAMRVFYNLLGDSGAHTSMGDILKRCKDQVLAVSSGNGTVPDQTSTGFPQLDAGQKALTVEDFKDDIASEVSGDEHSEMDDSGSLRDFVDDDDEEQPRRPLKRKRSTVTFAKSDDEDEPEDIFPRTPKRAQVSAPFGIGAGPVTPPSSQRKPLPRASPATPSSREKLPRLAKNTVDGSGYYNLKRLSYPK